MAGGCRRPAARERVNWGSVVRIRKKITQIHAGLRALRTLPHGHGRVHTCGMEVCELTAVALTVAPLPPPRSLRRAQASTSPRLA